MKPSGSVSVIAVPANYASIIACPCADDLQPPAEGNRILTFNIPISGAGLNVVKTSFLQIDLSPFYAGNQLRSIRSVSVDFICDSVGDGPSLWYLDMPKIADVLMLGDAVGEVGSVQPQTRSAV